MSDSRRDVISGLKEKQLTVLKLHRGCSFVHIFAVFCSLRILTERNVAVYINELNTCSD